MRKPLAKVHHAELPLRERLLDLGRPGSLLAFPPVREVEDGHVLAVVGDLIRGARVSSLARGISGAEKRLSRVV